MVSESQHNGSNAPSIRSPVVDEERMRPGHWLGLVFCVPFTALDLEKASDRVPREGIRWAVRKLGVEE